MYLVKRKGSGTLRICPARCTDALGRRRGRGVYQTPWPNPDNPHPPNLSGTCRRGRQKGVSLICSENKSEHIGKNRANRNKSEEHKSEQIGGAQIGTNRKKRGNPNKSEQIGLTPFRQPQKLGAPNLGGGVFQPPQTSAKCFLTIQHPSLGGKFPPRHLGLWVVREEGALYQTHCQSLNTLRCCFAPPSVWLFRAKFSRYLSIFPAFSWKF